MSTDVSEQPTKGQPEHVLPVVLCCEILVLEDHLQGLKPKEKLLNYQMYAALMFMIGNIMWQ